MNRVFADAAYWIALLNKRDSLHDKAKAVSSTLGRVPLVTSEMILAEVLDAFANEGANPRKAAVGLVRQLYENPNVSVVPQTSDLFQRALLRYEQRSDKAWGLTDCSSMIIMQEQGIHDVLTFDLHYTQAGFNALLRDDP